MKIAFFWGGVLGWIPGGWVSDRIEEKGIYTSAYHVRSYITSREGRKE